MKSDEEVLKECIKIAIDNGYTLHPYSFANKWISGKADYLEFISIKGGDIRLLDNRYEGDSESLLVHIMSHSFCKAFFGEEETFYVNIGMWESVHKRCKEWERHIALLALAEDRIDYLREYLEEDDLV